MDELAAGREDSRQELSSRHLENLYLLALSVAVVRTV